MKPSESLATSRSYFDEATENLTFEEFGWALEEIWCGVAWALNAIATPPAQTLDLGAKGQLPKPGSLTRILAALPDPPAEATRVVRMLESLRQRIARDPENLPADEIEQIVFDAWGAHDACAQRLELLDPRVDGAPPERKLGRRTALKMLFASGAALPLAACERPAQKSASAKAPATANPGAAAATNAPVDIKGITPIMAMQWPTSDPFLFCAYHKDDYPEGNADFGPAASLDGRHLGRDFEGKDNWRMYHGRTVPGFPRHPHRGFETVTVVREGLLDHADSMGAAARYGGGDVQWLTAGGGIQHAEMFPLLRSDAPNPLELFQIWLNLPRADKMVPPHFTMLWNEKIPRITEKDTNNRSTQITVAAGSYKGQAPPSPPPNSWASKPESDLAIWTLRMDAGATFTLPEVKSGTHRSLYFHRGQGAKVAGREVANLHRVEVVSAGPVVIEAAGQETEVLLLQGKPIGEPVAKRGPFVMNTQDEIKQAYMDYQRTQFGGWPWRGSGPVHPGVKGRFAKHIDGTFEEPT
ncbi:MAG: pirin-like C-terminal cupin domain-containing protein [Myxococcota bacterium]|nr:pirin-like C-terminal cupin domain-containing protein [Myxococcota bacterium]